MKNYGRTAVSEFLGDQIVYRNLNPVDERLPKLDTLRTRVGLPPGVIPRKSQPAYAQVIVEQLRQARALSMAGERIERLIFIGDTRLNDGTAFDNLCQAGGWPGLAFIGSESAGAPAAEIAPSPGGQGLYLANRWDLLSDFDRYCAQQGIDVDANTVVVFDLDKTTLGARGRNAHVIDGVRVQAVEDTVAALLGADFNVSAFRQAYNRLNQVEYHPFTSDNQDYLAYICLILGAGLYELDSIAQDVESGQLVSIEHFFQRVETEKASLPRSLAAIHADIYAAVQEGDPTPFKAFRRNEYQVTVSRMGHLGDDSAVKTLLEEEIVITQEVRSLALDWRSRGALLFALSDKPDEASLPSEELAAKGFKPIHRMETHAVGS